MKPAHLRLSRMLGYALTLGDAAGWQSFAMVAEARLSVLERGALAFAALNSLPRDCAETVAAAALGAADAPLPALLGGMQDARAWAKWATPQERKAYALAAFEAMTPQEQAAFFNHISTVEVAA